MKQLVNTLFLIFVFHVLISLTFIFFPPFLKGTLFAKIYKSYLLPGPFFRDDMITTTYNYLLLWKHGGKWEKPINPAKDYFNQYQKNLNPSNLYISRYIRSRYQSIYFRRLASDETNQFIPREALVFDQQIPQDVDSIRMMATRKYTVEFSIKIDTLLSH